MEIYVNPWISSERKKMKKLNFITSMLVIAFGMMLFPHTGLARMEPLNDKELSEITGHGGISYLLDKIGLDLDIFRPGKRILICLLKCL